MTYRDDRNALHQRAEALEAEVAALREEREQERARHARELEAARHGEPPAEPPVDMPARHQVNARAAFWMLTATAVLFAGVQSMRATTHACGGSGGGHHGYPPHRAMGH